MHVLVQHMFVPLMATQQSGMVITPEIHELATVPNLGLPDHISASSLLLYAIHNSYLIISIKLPNYATYCQVHVSAAVLFKR